MKKLHYIRRRYDDDDDDIYIIIIMIISESVRLPYVYDVHV